ncbi:hypothetical protein GCM10010503_37420 [Streptomyces lucensis JCM 4490]|uniref:D-alanine--D-alanine ligase C-terminal domain-containing protein n=1 Tax=Streptomyces lucensis JCM 4490 TaxID=1306176 RepID=A0A918MR84_9ACTN|nr:hypothetical protein [Streptomyces lucensis]GGW56722.1 hypothetical protein GCM10010503_37420 [Streptomyces lucensis JCM 4490]
MFGGLAQGAAPALLGAAGVPVPEQVLWRPGTCDAPRNVKRLVAAGPVVAKPAADGSSMSVQRVDSFSQLARVATEVHSGQSELLVKPLLPGREFTVAVVGDQVLPVVEIELATPVFDDTAKYQPGAVGEVCPARISDDLTSRLQNLALRAHKALGFAQ